MKCRKLIYSCCFMLFTPSVPSPEACVKTMKTITPLCFVLVVCGARCCLQTFLVRKCSSSQRKVLCLRETADKSVSSVKECFICEEDSSEYKTIGISMHYPPATTAVHATIRCSPFCWSAVQFTHLLGEVMWDRDSRSSSGFAAAILPVKCVSRCLRCCQSHSASSLTSVRVGELSAQFPWPVSSGGLLLYKQVMYYLSCVDTFRSGAVLHAREFFNLVATV